MTKEDNALIIIDNLIGDDQSIRDLIAQSSLKMQIGQLIYDQRSELGFNSEEFAELVGISSDIINDLEEGDYQGDYLFLLQKISRALKKNIQVSFLPREEKVA
jgi:DNA-binding XRE family transcriptional regulator